MHIPSPEHDAVRLAPRAPEIDSNDLPRPTSRVMYDRADGKFEVLRAGVDDHPKQLLQLDEARLELAEHLQVPPFLDILHVANVA